MDSEVKSCSRCRSDIFYSASAQRWRHTDTRLDNDHAPEEAQPDAPQPLPDTLIIAVLGAANATIRREFERMVEAHAELFDEQPVDWQMPVLTRGQVRAVLGAFLELEESGQVWDVISAAHSEVSDG